MEPKPTDLSELIRARIFLRMLRAKLNHVSIDAPISQTFSTEVDPLRSGQIIENLLSNVIKRPPGANAL